MPIITLQNINDLLQEFSKQPLYLKQISLEEIEKNLAIFLPEKTISGMDLSELHQRIMTLQPGDCTRVDKYTLYKKPAPSNPEQKLATIIPRSLIVSRDSDGYIIYIMLGSKQPNTGKSDIKERYFRKTKTNFIRIKLSPIITSSSIQYMALLTNIKPQARFSELAQEDQELQLNKTDQLYVEFNEQTILSKYCQKILPPQILNLDSSFERHNLYAAFPLGIDLCSYITRMNKNPDYLDKCATLASHIAQAICFLHSFESIHRNIKPDHITVIDSNLPQAYLIDFEFICCAGTNRQLTGTPDYMPDIFSSDQSKRPLTAEESKIFENFKKGHPAQDIWGFGATLLCMYKKAQVDSEYIKKYLVETTTPIDNIDIILHNIFSPKPEANYLSASLEKLRLDNLRPLNEQKYLSMKKIYFMLTGQEYSLDHKTKQQVKNDFLSFARQDNAVFNPYKRAKLAL